MRKGTISGIFIVALLAPLVSAITAEAVFFAVNVTTDDVDDTPGDGLCQTSSGDCTLRAAVMEANALGGADTINIPILGTIKLTRAGTGEDGAVNGDLDITGDVA